MENASLLFFVMIVYIIMIFSLFVTFFVSKKYKKSISEREADMDNFVTKDKHPLLTNNSGPFYDADADRNDPELIDRLYKQHGLDKK
jgi:hypothetical protein